MIGPAAFWMADPYWPQPVGVRLAPDALLTQLGLTGAVGDIDEDPDSADGSWLAAVGNLIPAATSGIETLPAGWAVLDSCTLSQSSAQAHSGTYSLALTRTASGSGAMSARPTPYTLIPVTPGETYTISAWTRAATTPRAAKVWLEWWDSSGNATGSGDNYWTGANSTSAWQQLTGSQVAPAGAAYARLAVQVDGPVTGEVHYFDDIELFPQYALRVSFPTPPAALAPGATQEFRVRLRPGT